MTIVKDEMATNRAQERADHQSSQQQPTGDQRFSPEEIAEHLAELENRAKEFSFGKTGFDYMYGSSAQIIRYLLSRDTGLMAAVFFSTPNTPDRTGGSQEGTPS